MAENTEETDTTIIEGGWRAAKDTLPEPDSRVIVAATHVNGTLGSERKVFEAKHGENGWFTRSEIDWPITTDPGDEEIYYRVTHWAPFPTLPERIGGYPDSGGENHDPDTDLRHMEPTS